MTLVLTVNAYESIWMLTDRRLSSKTRVVKDDARKMMILETTDGTAILGYAGLGATAYGTEPSDWISSVLRGRNLPLERSLAVLAAAMKKQFPRHMLRLPVDGGPSHSIIVTAFLGNEARFYTIDLDFAPDRKRYKFRYTRHMANYPTSARARTPALKVSGTGGLYLTRDMKWRRSLLNLVRAYDCRRISSSAVADYLASLNNEVHLRISDQSVGPRCIVVCRNRKGGIHKTEGGFWAYTGTTRDTYVPPLPRIETGLDLEAIAGVIFPRMNEVRDARLAGDMEKAIDEEKLKADLARLPRKPNENLR